MALQRLLELPIPLSGVAQGLRPCLPGICSRRESTSPRIAQAQATLWHPTFGLTGGGPRDPLRGPKRPLRALRLHDLSPETAVTGDKATQRLRETRPRQRALERGIETASALPAQPVARLNAEGQDVVLGVAHDGPAAVDLRYWDHALDEA
jgi:hypothetical protein